MAGLSYIRAQDVIAIQHGDAEKCTVMMAGGAQISCSEPAKEIKTRVEASLSPTSENPDGNGSG